MTKRNINKKTLIWIYKQLRISYHDRMHDTSREAIQIITHMNEFAKKCNLPYIWECYKVTLFNKIEYMTCETKITSESEQ
jgi:hypothetical protein